MKTVTANLNSPETRAALAELIALRELLTSSTLQVVRTVGEEVILPRIHAIAHGSPVKTMTARRLLKWAETLGAPASGKKGASA